MPLSISNFTGDGVVDPIIATSIELPDSGTSVMINGSVTPTAGAAIAVSGSPLTSPTTPGSGSIYWVIEVNTTTGVASIKQSTSSMPSADTGNIVVFAQTLASTSGTDPALVPTNMTPDTT